MQQQEVTVVYEKLCFKLIRLLCERVVSLASGQDNNHFENLHATLKPNQQPNTSSDYLNKETEGMKIAPLSCKIKRPENNIKISKDSLSSHD